MKKIKITESQKRMLESKAAAKLKEEINYSQSGSKKVSDTYKQAGANKLSGVKVEGVEEPTEVSMSELTPKVLDFIKQLYTNPSKEVLDPFWESINIEWDELIQLLTELQLIKSVSGGYRLQKLEQVGNPTSVVKIVSRLIQKLINNKNVPVEEDVDLSKDMNPSDMFKSMVGGWLKKFTNNRVEFLNNEGEFKNAWLTIRKIGKDATRRTQLDEDNYPAGVANDSNATQNQKDLPSVKKQIQQIVVLEFYLDEIALFSKDGKLYLYNVDTADKNEYEEYSSREETYLGRDEDGIPDVEYGEWEMDDEIVNRYVNDNLPHLSTGKGLADYENGVEFVEIDKELRQDLLGITKYIRDPKKSEQFVNTLNSINLEETTSAGGGSSGSFVGKLGVGGNSPIAKSNVASEMRNTIDEDESSTTLKDDIIKSITPFVKDSPKSSMLLWMSNERQLKVIVDKIQSLNDDEWMLMIQFIVKALQAAETYMIDKDKNQIIRFEHEIGGLNNFVMHFTPNIGEAITTVSAGGDSGTFAYDAPVGDGSDFWTKGNKMAKKGPSNESTNYRSGFEMTKDLLGLQEVVGREGKDAKTDTQWPDGQFVEFDDCVKYNNNKVAQNGGCSTGAVDNVVKTKGSKHSIISDSSIYESISKETGRTIEEVKSILDRKNNKSK